MKINNVIRANVNEYFKTDIKLSEIVGSTITKPIYRRTLPTEIDELSQ